MNKLHFCLLLLSVSTLSGCDQTIGQHTTVLSVKDLMQSCQKALDDKDINLAVKECGFTEQWLERVDPDSAQHAEVLEKLGNLFTASNPKAAETFYQKALTIGDKQTSQDHQQNNLQIKLASVLTVEGKWPDADLVLKKVLKSIETVKGPDSLEVADILNRLGIVQLRQQLLTDAEQSFTRALAIREKIPSFSGNILGETYNNLGFLYQSLGKNQEADAAYRKAIFNQETAKDGSSSQLYDSLSNLATLLQKQGKASEAEAYFKKLLVVSEKVFGKESAQYAQGLNSLGMLALGAKNYAVAEQLFNGSLLIREKKLGVSHILTAEAANNLAVAMANQGKRLQAMLLMRRAAAISEMVLGNNDPLTQQRWQSLLMLDVAEGGRNNMATTQRSQVATDPKNNPAKVAKR